MISFKRGIMIETTKLYILISVFDDLDLHSRSQFYEKSKTLCPISCKLMYEYG